MVDSLPQRFVCRPQKSSALLKRTANWTAEIGALESLNNQKLGSGVIGLNMN